MCVRTCVSSSRPRLPKAKSPYISHFPLPPLHACIVCSAYSVTVGDFRSRSSSSWSRGRVSANQRRRLPSSIFSWYIRELALTRVYRRTVWPARAPGIASHFAKSDSLYCSVLFNLESTSHSSKCFNFRAAILLRYIVQFIDITVQTCVVTNVTACVCYVCHV